MNLSVCKPIPPFCHPPGFAFAQSFLLPLHTGQQLEALLAVLSTCCSTLAALYKAASRLQQQQQVQLHPQLQQLEAQAMGCLDNFVGDRLAEVRICFPFECCILDLPLICLFSSALSWFTK